MRFGIDLGGTKTEIIALDDAGAERYRRRVATPASDAEAIVRCVRDLIEAAEREIGARGTVGVGTPGALSPKTGLLRNANTTCLNGRPLDRELSAALGRPVRIANDANCFALSEATDGAGRGAEVVFGVILGTGCGGGVVVRGTLLNGAQAIAGEWGHNPLPWPRAAELPGPACYCGKHGCVETFVSGPGLERDFVHAAGRACSGEQIATLAAEGDALAQHALDRHADRLARSLATVINVLDPTVIVLGGGVSQLPDIAQRVHARLQDYVFCDYVGTRLEVAKHGDSSGVRGAAWLWPAGAAT